MIRHALFIALLALPAIIFCQKPLKPNSADIFDAIQKAQVLGSVLYIAAHPDDENTRLIAHFSNHDHYHTTYLSLTRGDGGQNLIGTEIGPLLGLIRTQELLGARRIDGGNQLFSRANDFGYSKHPDETFSIWNKEEVLADVIWAIRKTRPDIIVNRFDHRSPGTTHGHHTGSAMLSYEAFTMAADKSVYPEQLKFVAPWQAERQFFNTSWWFYGSQEKFETADKSNMATVDVGAYYPTKGISNNEIASLSRSSHKSQGFGSTGSRGSEYEYLELVQGRKVTPEEDPLEGINTSWSRIPGGEKIGAMLDEIERDFDLANPAKSIPSLVATYNALGMIPDDGFWVPQKRAAIKDIIAWCAGLFVEAVADNFAGAPGQKLKIDIEAINRSTANVKLIEYSLSPGLQMTNADAKLSSNEPYKESLEYTIPSTAQFSSPYWLKEAGTVGMYSVEDQNLRGIPEDKRPVLMHYKLNIEGLTLDYETALVYKRNDPVDGEVYRPFEISPPIFLNFTEETLMFGSDAPKTVSLTVKAGASDVKGTISLNAPTGWIIEPAEIEVALEDQGQEEILHFEITPPTASSTDEVTANFTDRLTGEQFGYSANIIEYDHIPTQTVLKKAVAKAVKLDLVKVGNKVGYVMGAGDKVPEFLTQVGYEVTLLDENDLAGGTLSSYDAIVIGIRAYNTNERLKFYKNALLDYMDKGGNVIIQYNTNRGLNSEDFSPYPLQISRDRVTDEEAKVTILAPDHPVIKGPNQIVDQDFDGWVQERGLYFPNEWDSNFTAILSCHDPGESPMEGSLLVAPYGKGWFLYSGISWFRELPAGVPGAYRLFANMISLGKRSEP